MEDNQRDLRREITRSEAPKSKRKQRWTVLFVGEHGEVRTVRGIRAWIIFIGLLLAGAVATAAGLYMVYQEPQKDNRRLRSELAAVREQLNQMTSEKDLLMARLVLTESRYEATVADDTPPEEILEGENAGSVPVEGVDAPAKNGDGAAIPAVQTGTETELPTQASNETASATDAPVTPVDVKQLRVTHDPVTNMLHAQFMLRKVATDATSVSGRTFVVLKDDQEDAAQWIAIPHVPLGDGRPTQVRSGRYFSISRFNIVKFSSPFDGSPVIFEQAVVFVYSLDGTLILEKPFDVSITVQPSVVGEGSGE